MDKEEFEENQRTVTVKNGDEIYGVYDDLDYLRFRLKLVTGEIQGDFGIINYRGGIDKLDKFGNPVQGTQPFINRNRILREIIKAQCNIRIAELNKNDKTRELEKPCESTYG